MRKSCRFVSVFLCVCLTWSVFTVTGCGLNGSKDSDAISAQYIRTYHNSSTESSNYLVTTLIQSKEELDAYYENNKDIYSLGHHEDNPKVMDDSIGFIDACEKYTDEYFEDNKLVLVSFMENSGSIYHKVTGITYFEDALSILIERITPHACSADMMGWHILVELKDCDVLEEDVDIEVTFEDVEEKDNWWN